MPREFETALSFHARSVARPGRARAGSPATRACCARGAPRRAAVREIDRRRAGDGLGEDLLSLLIEARDEDGDPLPREQIRDEVMTLLFAGHDTTTSTVAFLFYELARNPQLAEDPGITMDMLIDETLRKYPPAYIGPRRSIDAFEFQGMPVPARAHVQYCSWASHHLPDVWPDPDRFDPYRFTPERKAALPRGAYVPFGGGSRTCIGMRFGQAEIAAITRAILERARLELVPGYELGIRHAPTISPRGGMPVTVRRAAPAALLDDLAMRRVYFFDAVTVSTLRAVAGAQLVAGPLGDEPVRALAHLERRRERAGRRGLDGRPLPAASSRPAGTTRSRRARPGPATSVPVTLIDRRLLQLRLRRLDRQRRRLAGRPARRGEQQVRGAAEQVVGRVRPGGDAAGADRVADDDLRRPRRAVVASCAAPCSALRPLTR